MQYSQQTQKPATNPSEHFILNNTNGTNEYKYGNLQRIRT